LHALKASCEEQARQSRQQEGTCAAQLQALEELRKLHRARTEQIQAQDRAHAEQQRVHTEQIKTLEIGYAAQLQRLEQHVTEPREAETAQLKQLTAQLQGLQKQQEQQSALDAQRLAAHSQAEVLAQQLWQKVQDLEQQQKALERTHQAEVQKVRDLEQQQEEANGRGLLQFEAEQLRNNEKLLSSKDLAFANPPRISPGSYTTPPAFLGGREEQLTRPSAPWTHSSRTRDFAYEQEKMRGNDRRPPPGSTYWLSLYVVVAARRSSSTL